MTKPFYIERLAAELDSRKRRNPAYTLRAFSRQIGIAAPVLSEVLRQKRGLPKKDLPRLIRNLQLSPAEARMFTESAASRGANLRQLSALKISETDYRLLDEERNFKIIAEWEYYAVFSLFDLNEFTPDLREISKRLSISKSRAEIVLNGLLAAGLLKKNTSGKIVKTAAQLTTSQDIQSIALRRSHKETLEMAAEKLETVPIEDRFYSSNTVAIDKSKLPEAKNLVREFRRKLTALLQDGQKDEIYQFSFQLFPLTETKELPVKENAL